MKETGKFQRGVALFNAGKFFEAHEVWEEIWLAEPAPEKTFLQGLIQLAAAFLHAGRGNMRGARSLLAAGIAKLERFPGDHRGLALAELRDEAKRWAASVGESGEPRARKPPRIRRARKTKRGG